MRQFTVRSAIFTLSVFVLPTMWPAEPPAPLKFEGYPANETLVGQPRQPILLLPIHRLYRTRLRRGIQYGEGLVGVAKPQQPSKPNFAGVFYAIAWGCGSDGCGSLAIVDGRTGLIYGPPPDADPSRSEFIATPNTSGCKGIEVRPASRLLFIERAEWSSDGLVCQRSYYEWQGLQYKFIAKMAVKAKP
jgi:hypothetical protein